MIVELVKSPFWYFWYLFKLVNYVWGRLVCSGLGQRGWRGGTVWNILNGGGTEKRGVEAKILKKRGQARSRNRCLKNGGRVALESPFETMMFTSTFLQGFFIHFYLLFISHCSLLFCNNIAIQCKMFYANPSQLLNTIKTN